MAKPLTAKPLTANFLCGNNIGFWKLMKLENVSLKAANTKVLKPEKKHYLLSF